MLGTDGVTCVVAGLFVTLLVAWSTRDAAVCVWCSVVALVVVGGVASIGGGAEVIAPVPALPTAGGGATGLTGSGCLTSSIASLV